MTGKSEKEWKRNHSDAFHFLRRGMPAFKNTIQMVINSNNPQSSGPTTKKRWIAPSPPQVSSVRKKKKTNWRQTTFLYFSFGYPREAPSSLSVQLHVQSKGKPINMGIKMQLPSSWDRQNRKGLIEWIVHRWKQRPFWSIPSFGSFFGHPCRSRPTSGPLRILAWSPKTAWRWRTAEGRGSGSGQLQRRSTALGIWKMFVHVKSSTSRI